MSSITDRSYQWLDKRIGLAAIMERILRDPVPERGGWWYTLGAAIFVLLIVQFLTGIFLMLYYIPSWSEARDSIVYIQEQVFLGWVVRGIHYWNMVALVLIVGIHMVRTFLSAAYKTPRKLTWVLGVILLVLMVGTAFTGGILRWDAAGYSDAIVGTTIAGWTPLLGPWVARLWMGGDVIGPLTLTRTFTFHVWLLPAPLLLLAVVHIAMVVIQGQFGSWINYESEPVESVPETEDERASREKLEQEVRDPRSRKVNVPMRTTRFYPHHIFKEGVVSLGLFIAVLVATLLFAAPIDEPVDPASASYTPSSMWFWLFLDQMLLLFPGQWLIPLGAVVVPTVVLVLIMALPWFDRGAAIRPAERPAVIAFMFVLVTAIFVLGLLAASRVYNYEFIDNPPRIGSSAPSEKNR